MPQKLVLIIDDDRDSADMLALLLGLMMPQIATSVAYGGREGLAKAADSHPDFVIVDLEMPDMHGADVAAMLRETQTGKPPAMIAISGDIAGIEAARLDRNFAQAFLKPVNTKALLQLIEV